MKPEEILKELNYYDKTYDSNLSTNIKHNPKIKVVEIDQIFEIIDDKPYYSLKYRKIGENYYHIGYSSYDFHNVLQWKLEYFELVNCAECKYGWKNVAGRTCQACINKNMFEKR